ncbi:hypothetical protein [Yersinia enterocolitica]|uniref:hypothetical protein n=1 Tax=Yersinia enterocolitica TaxID=630 RepID=UPI001C60A5DF|nr:hypothetical protein [Yersinia enterocolitica]MBW5819572.1 hypothetical protein [Yersinia enterocolitica]
MKKCTVTCKYNNNIEKRFLVLGYAVNKRGLTKHAHATVYATNPMEAIRHATEELAGIGLTHFKALKVTNLTA